MAIRITKEPDTNDDDENDLARIAKLLIPFLAFFVLSLMIGEAWQEWSFNTRAAVILIIMLAATLLYRKELSGMLYEDADDGNLR